MKYIERSKKVSKKMYLILYIFLIFIGLYFIEIGDMADDYYRPYNIAGTGFILAGWLSVFLLSRSQNYRYLPNIIFRHISKAKSQNDERELAIRRKVYERCYSITVFFITVYIVKIIFQSPQYYFGSITSEGTLEGLSRLTTWVFLNIIIFLIFLPSLLAMREE